jgi:hypothetical protein
VACDRSESRKIRTSTRRTAVMARSVSGSDDDINADNKYSVSGRHSYRGRRASPSRRLRARCPPTAQPLAMPADNGVRLDENQCLAPVPPGLGEHDPEDSVAGTQLWTSDGAPQDRQLLPKRQILKGDGTVPGARSSRWFGGGRRALSAWAILSPIKPQIQSAGQTRALWRSTGRIRDARLGRLVQSSTAAGADRLRAASGV